jgi:CheY-like chemotaxis protein
MLWPTHRFPPTHSDARFRILYVGNDLDLIAALRTFLTKPDHKIVTCMDCSSAVFFLKGDPRYELLVFDLGLGSRRVLKLIPLARSLSHRRHLPIIVLTETMGAAAEELPRTGSADDVLSRNDMGGVARSVARLLTSVRN